MLKMLSINTKFIFNVTLYVKYFFKCHDLSTHLFYSESIHEPLIPNWNTFTIAVVIN